MSPDSDLNALAEQASNLVISQSEFPGGIGHEEASQAKAEADAAQQQAQMLEAAAGAVIMGLLAALRKRIIKQLPEFEEECPLEMLQGPAAASVDLLRDYIASLANLAGPGSKYAMLAVSLLPIGMAYISAIDKHSKASASRAPTQTGGGDAPGE